MHALEKDQLFDNAEFEQHWRDQGEMGGSENDLWYDESTGIVWKRNRVDVLHLSYRQFMERMLLHNAFFPEATIRLQGFTDTAFGIAPLFTQPDVVASSGGTREQVEPLLTARGYSRVMSDDYAGPLMVVEDLHPGNVLVDGDGNLHVIDPVLFPR